ncbi:MAG: hypothetical protein QXM68_01240 [Candidatus Aenigmatarchaeota archaeon]|nr:DsbA family protein [Candidatus Aenigmarchaeota archaeon]
MKQYIAVLLLLIISFIIFYRQKVEIIYFYSKDCIVSNQTDSIIEDIERNFNRNVNVIYVDGFNPEGERQKKMVDLYNINSVPVIIIDGSVFKGEFTYESLKSSICERFVFKPSACFK